MSYIESQRERIEQALSDAVEAVCAAKPDDPLIFIGEFLLTLAGYPPSTASAVRIEEENETLRRKVSELEASLAELEASRNSLSAEAAWEPFRMLLDGEAATREPEAGARMLHPAAIQLRSCGNLIAKAPPLLLRQVTRSWSVVRTSLSTFSLEGQTSFCTG